MLGLRIPGSAFLEQPTVFEVCVLSVLQGQDQVQKRLLAPNHQEIMVYVFLGCRGGMRTASCSAASRLGSRGSACPAWWSSCVRCSLTGRWSTASPSPMMAGTTRSPALVLAFTAPEQMHHQHAIGAETALQCMGQFEGGACSMGALIHIENMFCTLPYYSLSTNMQLAWVWVWLESTRHKKIV